MGGEVGGESMGGSWSVTWVTISPRVGMLGQRSQRIRIPRARDRFGYEWDCSAGGGRDGRVTCVWGVRGETMGGPWWGDRPNTQVGS